MKDFITALQFLTTIRISKSSVKTSEDFARGMLFFPLIGLLIGGILALIGTAGVLIFPSGVLGAVLLIAEIMLSGGLHLDGYMDTMDGVFSGRSRERMLEIMKDSRVGANAVIALSALLILKYTLLVQLVELKLWETIVLMPALSRFAIGIGTALFPYVRPEGLGKGFAEYFKLRRLLVTAVYTAFSAWLILNQTGLLLFAGVTLWAWIFGKFIAGRLGGLTGDTYGAINELSEVVYLLFACAIVFAYKI